MTATGDMPSWDQIEHSLQRRCREQVNLRLDPMLYRRLRMMAVARGYRFPSDLVEQALRIGLQHLEQTPDSSTAASQRAG